jgi:hypothetical protein
LNNDFHIGKTTTSMARALTTPSANTYPDAFGCGRINYTITAYGTSEQWVFGFDDAYAYAYFTNGILTAIQK